MINRKINNIDVMIDERNAALYIDTQNKVDFKYGNIDEILNFFYNKTYSPLSVYFELTNCCNFNCPFCYINIPKEKKVFLDTKSLLENIDYLTDNGMLFATLSDGECLLHKDFNIIYEYLCKKGILVNILTNGSLIDNEKIKLFKKYKPFKVEISIYGKDNVTYYNNTIQDHIGFENIINNCKKLQDNNINVICKMPINNITSNSFFDVLYFTKKNDIPFYYSDELFNKYSGEDNKQYLIKGSSKVKDFIKNNNLSYMSNLDLNYCGEKKCFDCKAGKYSMIISYDNYIYPCFEFRQIKNARFKIDGNFKQALAKMIEYINLYKNNIISKCDNCLNYSICQDCVINFIKNEFNCDIYTELRNNILDYKKETKLNMKNKYDTKELECERLVLKKGTSEDCIKVYEYDMLKCRGVGGINVLEKSLNKIDFIGSDSEKYYDECIKNRMYDWYVYLKDGTPIGNVVADREDNSINSIELSFNMHPNYWRKGYMTEAVKCIINYLLDNYYDNIIIGYDTGNVRSKSFIEKLGFNYYKTIKNVYEKNGIMIDTTLLIMNKNDWNL